MTWREAVWFAFGVWLAGLAFVAVVWAVAVLVPFWLVLVGTFVGLFSATVGAARDLPGSRRRTGQEHWSASWRRRL